MMGRGLFVAASATAFALLFASGSGAAHNGVFVPATPGQPLPPGGHAVKSTNWSGYVVTSQKHPITGVKSKFTVPSGGSPTGYASNWTGIGGYGTSDLIQAGTSEFFAPSKNYFAWYEMLPGPETALHGCQHKSSCPVKPGDKMVVVIKQNSSKKWHFSIQDKTAGWSWSKTVTYNSKRASAEWILEAPTVGGGQSSLPHGLGTSFFGPTSTYTVKGNSHTIAQGKPVTIDLVRGSTREATPSLLGSNGQSFNSCAWASSCPTP